MTNYETLKKMVLFDDNKRGIKRTRQGLELAIKERRERIRSTACAMRVGEDYDDSRTEY